MGVAGVSEAVLAVKFAEVLPHLDERQRRLVLGAEARSLGHGGIGLVARAAGVSVDLVSAGVAELAAGAEPGGRVRRLGGGRPRLTDTDPGLVRALLELVEPDMRGDPMSPLRWTTKSSYNLARELTGSGRRISADTVADLLRAQGFSLQGNAKVLEGSQHPDRDVQFRYINDQVKEHQGAGQPVVSVDAKKKEIVGAFKNPGRQWSPKGEPVRVDTHDFPDTELGKVAPYGVYDLAANTGWVNVGSDHDTAAFAIASIRGWWNARGRAEYPDAARLLITADAGGSNGYHTRAWKTGLADLADETGLSITVCHFPPGTSKWNRIEHRLFSAFTMNWRGRPLTSHEVIVNSIAATTTKAGLRVHAELDTGLYPVGIQVSDAEMDAVPLLGHAFHGDWNYTTCPRSGGLVPDLDPTDPRLTGLSQTDQEALAAELAPAYQAARKQAAGRAPNGRTGRPPKLDLATQLAATLAHQRLGLPPSLLARLLDVGKKTADNAVKQTLQLLDQHGYPPVTPVAHLTTSAGLAHWAAQQNPDPTS